MIHDRDGKFPAQFDAILAGTGIPVVVTGCSVNSIIERWIQTCRTKLLDHTLILTQTTVDRRARSAGWIQRPADLNVYPSQRVCHDRRDDRI
jgi:hypothetical protein